MIFTFFSQFFRCKIWNATWKGKTSRKIVGGDAEELILNRPGGMCVAWGRDREGVIRRSRPRLLKLSNLGLKILGQDFDLESSTRRHLRWGGGSICAFRRKRRSGPAKGSGRKKWYLSSPAADVYG